MHNNVCHKMHLFIHASSYMLLRTCFLSEAERMSEKLVFKTSKQSEAYAADSQQSPEDVLAGNDGDTVIVLRIFAISLFFGDN